MIFVLLRPDHALSERPSTNAQEFIGAQACNNCHGERDLSGAGYNILEEVNKSAHPFAATLPETAFPSGTNEAGVPLPPDGPPWGDYAYILGGFGWKATYVFGDGGQLTGDQYAQYNLESQEWTAYHPGETLGFDVECSRCHTTGTSQNGSWNGVSEDSLGTWTELGVQCEGCHGPSSLHVSRRFTTSEGETRVLLERCGDCHNNGGKENPIPVVEKFVVNHAQYQELEASRHGSLGFFTCSTCHEPHLALKYAEQAGVGNTGRPLKPIRQECQDCHTFTQTNHPEPITCVACHMPSASKSAVGLEFENGGARGDIASHIWRINTSGVPRDSMFTEDGAFLKPDASGWLSVTLDFACLGCHQQQEETLSWAASYAKTMHMPVDTSAEEPDDALQKKSGVRVSNYPNPFQSETTITYELSHPTEVRLSIYDVRGREIVVLQKGFREEGRHILNWDGASSTGIPAQSGMYFVQIIAGEENAHQTLHLVR